ncbi:MAG: DNA topoisomerase I [Gammaproteobacteria bacterium]
MTSNLVVVESPAKANTIERYLGKDFAVLASYGHVRDLLPKKGAVDTENGFEMKYETVDQNNKHVAAIVKAMKKADVLYLATDLDREGEAISWHLAEILKDKKLLKNKKIYRVVFSEITKGAIQSAIQAPRELSMEMVNAQQARRALDYLVGFNLSPLLWKKIARGLSAGRVQSPALRMIVEREEEIERFDPKEYWTIEASNTHGGVNFGAKLNLYQNEKIKQFTVTNAENANKIRDDLIEKADGKLLVSSVEKKQRKRNPSPPFITSTLQQEGVRKLGFTAQRVMRTAQQLYEGITIEEGSVGLITYMRTDSVNLAQEALSEIRDFVSERYGKTEIPPEPRMFKSKSKNAQEAHEAVRPTSARRTPTELKPFLSADQFKLYDLIWKRTVASQMKHATIDQVGVDLKCGEGNSFRASGSTVADPGFMAVYLEGKDDSKESDSDEKKLPVLKEGETVNLNEILADQHFTEPPPRFTEASIVKTLEEYGIGRPSTYASIISTLIHREYVEFEKKRFTPTDMGRLVNKFLTDHFSTYVDYEFTANLEDKLDEISRGEKQWIPVLEEFWTPFEKQLIDKEENVSRKDANQARELGADPKTGEPVTVRMGRFGAYVQIGDAEADEKPRFYGLQAGQKLDTITLDEAMELTKLPRDLGEDLEGNPVSTNVGRFGPYVRYGNKYVSIKDGDDPYTITLDRALELIELKKKEDAEKNIKEFAGTDIKVLKGRYGPYVTDGKKNARIPKDKEPESITLEEATKMIEEAPERGRGKKKSKAKAKAKTKSKTKSKSKSKAKKKAKAKSKTKSK